MTEAPHLHATRIAYDTVAADYAEQLKTLLADTPMDRAMLGVFAELVQGAGALPVADLGCGPGRVTGYLDSLGLDVFGVDLSPAMVEVARETYPHLRFEVGSMTAVDRADGTLGGIVAWYSIIHTPPELLPIVFGEFHRLLGPGGHVVLAFQVGDERVHVEHAYGHVVSADAYRLPPDHVAELLGRAGFVTHARLVREPGGEMEKTPQAYLMAHKPVDQ